MKRKIVIADADEDFRTELVAALKTNDAFEVIGVAADGEDAIKKILVHKPDILVLDILLPRCDGITVLERIQSTENRPQVLATSSFISNYITVSTVHLGVQQLLHKPCDVDVVVRNLQRMATEERGCQASYIRIGEQSVASMVASLLHEIGVPAHIKGYQYLREAIILAVKDEDESNAILKCRHNEVACVFGTTAKKVESAIRRAIEMAWDRGDLATLQRYFGYSVSNTNGKPTSSEFIAIVAEQIQLQRKNNLDPET